MQNMHELCDPESNDLNCVTLHLGFNPNAIPPNPLLAKIHAVI